MDHSVVNEIIQISKMERTSLAKRSIFIYPMPLTDTLNLKSKEKLPKNKLKIESDSKFCKCKSLGVDVMNRSQRNSHLIIPRNSNKKWTYPLQTQRLCKLKVGPMLTPKVQSKWIDLFLDTVEMIEPDHSLKNSLKKSQISLNNIIKELPRKNNFLIRRQKHGFKAISESIYN